MYVYSGMSQKISLTAGPIVQHISGKFIISHCKELFILKLGHFFIKLKIYGGKCSFLVCLLITLTQFRLGYIVARRSVFKISLVTSKIEDFRK